MASIAAIIASNPKSIQSAYHSNVENWAGTKVNGYNRATGYTHIECTFGIYTAFGTTISINVEAQSHYKYVLNGEGDCIDTLELGQDPATVEVDGIAIETQFSRLHFSGSWVIKSKPD